MRAAVEALRGLGPERIVVAVPVGAPETCAEFEREADEAEGDGVAVESSSDATETGR